MMPTNQRLIFRNAEQARDSIMASQKKEIAQLYQQWADEVGRRAEYYSKRTNPSATVSATQMRELQKMMESASQQVSNEVFFNIKSNLYMVSDAVVKCNSSWLAQFGFSEDGINAAFNHVPDQIVRNIITGQIYEGGWNLSQAIWGDNEKTMKDIYQIVAKGLAENRSVYDVAKELQQYVTPGAKKGWNPVLKMKNTLTGETEYKRIYKSQVDYSAQRLARTLSQHGYQQSFIATTQNNPFITEYVWHSNGSRPCALCQSRDGAHYQKDSLPMDHPNGMCTMEPVVASDMVSQLANWFNSPSGTYPEIDAFAGNFGYEAKPAQKKTPKPEKPAVPRHYTSKQIEKASKFIQEFEMEDDAKQAYMDTLQGTSREFQNAFVDAMKKKVKVWDYDDHSYYSPKMHAIFLDSSAVDSWSMDYMHCRQTLFHEIGHAIDDLAAGAGKYSKSPEYGFVNAMMDDLKAMNAACKKGDWEYIIGLRAMVGDDSSRGVQDIMSAMPCKGIGLKDVADNVTVRWSHSQEYFERKNAKNEAASELFANMCGAKADPKAQEYISRYFPNASKVFEAIISDIGK